MANRPQFVTEPLPRRYTRTEFAALRAWVLGTPTAIVARLYPSLGAQADLVDGAPHAPARFLRTMRADVVRLALQHGSPELVESLRRIFTRYGSKRLTLSTLKLVERVALSARATPHADHALGLWLRPLICRHLEEAGLETLGDLVGWINVRGSAWWRGLPRIGPARARTLVTWLRLHEASIGVQVDLEVSEFEPRSLCASPDELIEIMPPLGMATGALGGERRLAPLERMTLPKAPSGANGSNRASVFPYVRAHHDLEAIRAYLAGFEGQAATQRAYRRELERLLLWAIAERGTALSSLTVEDCEAFKAFLAAPSAAFTGPPVSRASGRWRPFAPKGLSPASRRYAVRTLRAAFDWLVNVRYLAGNPWRVVRDPMTVQRVSSMRIERALPIELWTRVRAALAARALESQPSAPRWRTARALLLLMGDAGLRIAEAAGATREALTSLPADDEVPETWWLTVVGKGRKERFVPLSDACVAALAAHWGDRGLAFWAEPATGPLIAPLQIPRTPRARAKFGADNCQARPTGYSPRGARGLTQWALRELRMSLANLSESARRHLAATSPHALRHTFGTQAVAADVPLDVVQRVLGHASLQTTTTYVTAEQRRVRIETAKYHARLARAKSS